MSFAWRKPILHPFTTVSLIVVALQISSKAGTLLRSALRLHGSLPSLFLLVPFHFSIHGLESSTRLSKGSHITTVPTGEK